MFKDLSDLEKFEEYLKSFDDGDEIGYSENVDVCPCCGANVNSVFHFHYEHNGIKYLLMEYITCHQCDNSGSWGDGESGEIVFDTLYNYFENGIKHPLIDYMYPFLETFKQFKEKNKDTL